MRTRRSTEHDIERRANLPEPYKKVIQNFEDACRELDPGSDRYTDKFVEAKAELMDAMADLWWSINHPNEEN